MSTKVMLVDDDMQFRRTVKRSLEMNDYEVIEANHGGEALDILMMETVDLVLSDVKMPKLNGIELLHRVKRDKPDIPFIMMTGFSEVIEIKEAYEIGADGFLSKPYKEDDLIFQVEKVLNIGVEEDGKRHNYLGIAVEEFVAGAQIKYPIYIKLDGESFVKIANVGEDLSSAQVKTFKEKGISEFYLEANDFIKHLNFNVSIMGSLMRSERITASKKLKFIKIILHQCIQYCIEVKPNEDVIKISFKVYENLKKLYEKNKGLVFNIDCSLSNERNNDLLAISICYLPFLTSQIDWLTESVEKDFFVSSILQDICITDGKEHPFRATELLGTEPFVNEQILKIIAHHHEKVDGSGYPSGLKGSAINPLGNLLQLSYSFARSLKMNDYDIKKASKDLLSKEAHFYKKDFILLLKNFSEGTTKV